MLLVYRDGRFALEDIMELEVAAAVFVVAEGEDGFEVDEFGGIGGGSLFLVFGDGGAGCEG